MSGEGVDDPIARAALARVLPADAHAGIDDPGLEPRLRELAATHHRKYWERSINPGSAHLEVEAQHRHQRSILDLTSDEQDALLTTIEHSAVETEWADVTPYRFLDALIKVATEVFYATPGTPAWPMVGYEPGPSRGAGVAISHTALSTTEFGAIDDGYDAVIIGAGPGGGTAAGVLCEAGLRVLLVDRDEFQHYDDVGRDHLANHRLSTYGHNTGPDDDGNPRVYAGDGSHDELVVNKPWDMMWSNNAMTVGGGARVYQGMAWRLLPEDFRLASIYGVPDRSSLADWPLDYDELEPYYDRAEWELGVCGDGSAHPVMGHRSRPYPMKPFGLDPEGERLAEGAKALGLNVGPVPLLINSEPYNGRAQCVGCGECVGFACPSDAKNGSWNTYVIAALQTGRCDLVTGTRAEQITVDAAGRVTGVDLVQWATGARRHVRGGQVVVAAGAMESARLLLASRSGAHPDGIGNGTDQVGRHLQGHHYVFAFGLFDDPVIDMNGPGVTIGTCDYNHDPASGVIGGAIHNEVIKLPILHHAWALPPGTPRWGLDAKSAMRDLYLRTSHLYGPIQEIPTPDCRITLADGVLDKHGAPVAKWGGAYHPDTVKASDVHRHRAQAWLQASGATETWMFPPAGPFGAGQHQAGTCRMGDDPVTSVTDRWGRVHGHDNLWVMDGSLHVSNGGFNPVLSIYALALRAAEKLASG
ncbi:MAG: glucose-methanol-choline oxidoreductase [Acidimicrobiales bacterium]|nr:glucose-methanol-choline oxidoreductase [Acidimicrobiales bacterium]